MGAQKKWTANGAARQAREARALTVPYLRMSPVAHTLTTNGFDRGLSIYRLATGSREMAETMLYAGMGFRAPYPADTSTAARLALQHEADRLAEAELYVVSPEMVNAAVAAALTLTPEDLELVNEDDLPGLTGLVMLPEPLLVRTTGGDMADLRAITWKAPATAVLPQGDNPAAVQSGVYVTTFHDAYGPVQSPETRELLTDMARAGTPMPPLWLDAQRFLPFRYVQPDDAPASRFAAASRAHDQHATALTGIKDEIDAEYTPGRILDDSDGLLVFKILYAFWRLCEQRIAVLEPAEINHSARLAAARTGYPAEVRIVRLRTADNRRGFDAPQVGREWQHRWPVRMHKVRQWFPSLNQHRILLRGPYIKGPNDKPMIGGETVRGLVR